MTHWNGSGLLEPIAPEEPCGKNLEDTDTLASFDAYQIFGQTSLEPEPKKDNEPARREPRKSDRPPNWEEIRDGALTALRSSKDLRLLAYLGAAVLRTEGIPAFVQTLSVASRWLETYWANVFPLIDEDALFRQNALNCFADPVAVIDGLRRAPLVSSRQHGRYSLRDMDIVAGQVTPVESERRPDGGLIKAAFEATAIDELKTLLETVTGGVTALGAIDGAMRNAAGSEMAPSLESLTAQLKKIAVVLRTQLAAHPAATVAEAAAGDAPSELGYGSGVVAVGAIKSRQDAIRALDAAAEFFRRNEPSSPVPMFVERAKRLVAKNFLEVLADVAPDALPQARSAGGVKDE
jgi:type VI secretion system protein ImpA